MVSPPRKGVLAGRLSPTSEEARSTQQTNARSITIPSANDVLFGRGSVNQEHVGNIRFRAFITEMKPKYDRAERDERGKMATYIVETIKSTSGRFLREDRQRNCWAEVDDVVARNKVTHAFRNMRRSDNVVADSNQNADQRGPLDAIPPAKRLRLCEGGCLS